MQLYSPPKSAPNLHPSNLLVSDLEAIEGGCLYEKGTTWRRYGGMFSLKWSNCLRLELPKNPILILKHIQNEQITMERADVGAHAQHS